MHDPLQKAHKKRTQVFKQPVSHAHTRAVSIKRYAPRRQAEVPNPYLSPACPPD